MEKVTMIILLEEEAAVMLGGSGSKGDYKSMTKEQKRSVASNYRVLKNNIRTVNKYSNKNPRTNKQAQRYSNSLKAVNESLDNIKKSDLEFGLTATQTVINNDRASQAALSVGISALTAIGLSVATGGTWIPIMKPDLNNKPAQKAIDELRSTYKYKLE
jgi:hypothetical protein